MASKPPTAGKPAPLKIACGTADCEAGLHCYHRSKRAAKAKHPDGTCRECGAELVDWERVRARDAADVPNTFDQLRTE